MCNSDQPNPLVSEGELASLNQYLDQYKERADQGPSNCPAAIVLHVPEGMAETYKATLMKHLTNERMEMLVITDAPVPERDPLIYQPGMPWTEGMLPKSILEGYQLTSKKPKKAKCLSHHGTGASLQRTKNQRKASRRTHR